MLERRTIAIYCGTVAANSITFGEGSGPRTYELRVTSGPGGGGLFSVPDVLPLPTIGSYICGQIMQGVPMNGLIAWLGPSDPGYVASTLPSTSVQPESGTFGAGVWLGVDRTRRPRWRGPCPRSSSTRLRNRLSGR